MSEEKICSYCLEYKPLIQFAKNKNCLGGYDVRCKQCMKIRNSIIRKLRNNAPQKNDTCDCCKRPNINLPGRKKTCLVLDHDPSTGLFRGWICDKCNKAIGMLGDNFFGVNLAKEYLERFDQSLPKANEISTTAGIAESS